MSVYGSTYGSRATQNNDFDLNGFLQALPGSTDDLDDCLVIGLDFGTTFSGASWATINELQKNQIQTITTWPGTQRQESKAPTRLFYEYVVTHWGFEVPEGVDSIQWFKLLLLREDDMPPNIRSNDSIVTAKRLLGEYNKTVVDCIADYLRALWCHTIKTIQKARSDSVVSNLTFHVVITIPAIWKDYAREAMRNAVEKAGILQERPYAGKTILSFVPEPEAAGLASLGLRRRNLKSGDVYVICDAGGGTVDVISYRVGELKPITLHEAVVGTGGICGGIFVDSEFKVICKARLGRRWSRLNPANIKLVMDSEWETKIKSRYYPNSKRSNIVEIPDDAFIGEEDRNDRRMQPYIIDGSIHFSSSDIAQTFTKAFANIDNLVDNQVQSAREKGLSVKGIVLVGGFGTSPYLYQHLESRYKGQNLKVIHSSDTNPNTSPRTAICRGAVLKGFIDGLGAHSQNMLSVGSTIARQSLGVAMNQKFKEGVHRKADKYWHEVKGEWWARKQIQWYIYKGQDILKSDPILHGFSRSFANKSDFENSTMSSRVLQCDSENPPKQINHPGVSELCEITWNTRGISYKDLDRNFSDFGKYKSLEYDIEVRPSGASHDFAVMYQGRKLGSQNVGVAYD